MDQVIFLLYHLHKETQAVMLITDHGTELVAVELAVQVVHTFLQVEADQVEAEVQIILMVMATLIQVVAVEMEEDLQDHIHKEMADLEAAEELDLQVEL